MYAHNRKHMKPGDRYGRLVVVRETESRNGRSYCLCRCDCGKELEVLCSSLRTGNTKSCGCLQREATSTSNRTHGMCKSRLYRVYSAMKRRCTVATDPAFARYGGRGITLCASWSRSFSSFYSWAVRSGYKNGLSIERKDNDKGYCPSNCTWIPKPEQAKNRTMNVYVNVDGTRMCLSDAARKFGVTSPIVAQARVRNLGWDPLKAVSTPTGANSHRMVEYAGEAHSVVEWARRLGLPYNVLQLRLSRGWPVEKAMTYPLRVCTQPGSRKQGDLTR